MSACVNTVQRCANADEASFFNEVLSQLHQLSIKIKDHCMWRSFWDETREGNEIVERRPKRERAIQPMLARMLDHLEPLKNISVVREPSVGAGDLDLCFTTSLRNGRVAHVCAEVKCLHSDDLAHGLQRQLPAYMRAKQTDLGIYIVLNFGEGYQPKERRLVAGLESVDYRFTLPIVASELGRFVKVAFVDVGPVESPSKL